MLRFPPTGNLLKYYWANGLHAKTNQTKNWFEKTHNSKKNNWL